MRIFIFNLFLLFFFEFWFEFRLVVLDWFWFFFFLFFVLKRFLEILFLLVDGIIFWVLELIVFVELDCFCFLFVMDMVIMVVLLVIVVVMIVRVVVLLKFGEVIAYGWFSFCLSFLRLLLFSCFFLFKIKFFRKFSGFVDIFFFFVLLKEVLECFLGRFICFGNFRLDLWYGYVLWVSDFILYIFLLIKFVLYW